MITLWVENPSRGREELQENTQNLENESTRGEQRSVIDLLLLSDHTNMAEQLFGFCVREERRYRNLVVC